MFQFLLAQKPTVVTFRCDSSDMTNSLTVVKPQLGSLEP